MVNLTAALHNLGMPHQQAVDIAEQVKKYLLHGQQKAWEEIKKNILTHPHYQSLPFSVHYILFETVFPDCKKIPRPAWFPDKNVIGASNIYNFMQELHFSDYTSLHRWSVNHYSDFWQHVIHKLNIIFDEPYTKIVDLTKGITAPRWLTGATFNIVTSCLQKEASALAILYQKLDGQISRMSYGELNTLSDTIAASLTRYTTSGDRVAIVMPMTPEAIAIYLGIIKAGCCAVPVAESFAADEIHTRFNLANVKMAFTQDVILRDNKKIPLYEKIKQTNLPLTVVLPHDELDTITLRDQDLSWNNFLKPMHDFHTVTSSPEAYTTILFSSGTTSVPKAIPWTQVTPIKCGADGFFYQNIQSDDLVCWLTSLGWMMGPWLIYATFLNQAAIALYEGSPTGVQLGEFIQNNKITILGLVPSHIKNWRLSGCMENLDWRSIKLFSSSGECSTVEDMLYLMSLANYQPIIEYCGGTEIGGSYITSTVLHPSAPGAFSVPALGIDFLILDQNKQETEKGEAVLIPPSIGLSTELLNKDHYHTYYAHMPTIDNKTVRRHGDLVEKFNNGFYRLCGRIDDTMNLGGIKISSVEIEEVLNSLTQVHETAAIPLNLPEGGPSKLIIYAVTNSPCPHSIDQLKTIMQDAIKKQLNPLFKIHDLVLVDQLPKTASNKLIRKVLREQYEKQQKNN